MRASSTKASCRLCPLGATSRRALGCYGFSSCGIVIYCVHSIPSDLMIAHTSGGSHFWMTPLHCISFLTPVASPPCHLLPFRKTPSHFALHSSLICYSTGTTTAPPSCVFERHNYPQWARAPPRRRSLCPNSFSLRQLNCKCTYIMPKHRQIIQK